MSLNQDDLISAHALARVDTETFLTRRGRVVVKTMLCEHGVGVAKEYMDLDADSEDGKTWCMYKWEYTHGLERKKVDKYFL